MNWQYISSILPALLAGTQTTLVIFFTTLVLSVPLGIVVSVGLRSHFKPLAWILKGYVWLMRGTPLLLQLIFIFYGLPVIQIYFDRMSAVFLAFVLNYAAYFAEIFRGGLQGIDQGQYDAAKVLKLSSWQTFRLIILPQVVKSVIPAVGNEVINLVKDSSLVYVLGIGDLLRAGNIASARDVTLVPLVLVGVVYLLLTALLTWGLHSLEKHYAYYR
ncbi:amino acid ABC transporter permease [Schleiferilactobacillus perolens]|jgi:polar amino acid transport system permease protein|uniref:Amino acid ABC superfamily ATP binding cassette transporter, membrane protein n=1 Tax=Schleiferilactobacillus perolens DSM 12744 TaxID=1423792 RepID=A0A0R1N239_9LACO|nr:amino acid ABC transporter permease [Schleiferilactobacillus perolens]KRL14225.1 amino acid ABC superfamily ATP binding cassette transporter, membrane protein [Schleiferilactobacillus perolens DSM 12744]MCI1892494.1 amino acid ABC transporter permease [Schleiferilactobacillus harbinensis]MCI1913338.1 amino acid ABC transporter permease [Schleiferilactobacillus harbinensis]MCI2171972.1 amino acid ABC transporter permease [Schleiferilactobacillus perolens]